MNKLSDDLMVPLVITVLMLMMYSDFKISVHEGVRSLFIIVLSALTGWYLTTTWRNK